MTVRNWLPLIGMTASAFVFNTSEFMPIGLLSDIASDLRITEAHAGMLISIYAWVVALLSLPLMLMVCKMEFKKLLLSIIVLFIVSHVFSAMATGFWTLMLSRIGVACAHSIFWSIAAPMAVRTVPEEHKSLALGMIVTGTSVAMIVGLPLGRIRVANGLPLHCRRDCRRSIVSGYCVPENAQPQVVLVAQDA